MVTSTTHKEVYHLGVHYINYSYMGRSLSTISHLYLMDNRASDSQEKKHKSHGKKGRHSLQSCMHACASHDPIDGEWLPRAGENEVVMILEDETEHMEAPCCVVRIGWWVTVSHVFEVEVPWKKKSKEIWEKIHHDHRHDKLASRKQTGSQLEAVDVKIKEGWLRDGVVATVAELRN